MDFQERGNEQVEAERPGEHSIMMEKEMWVELRYDKGGAVMLTDLDLDSSQRRVETVTEHKSVFRIGGL